MHTSRIIYLYSNALFLNRNGIVKRLKEDRLKESCSTNCKKMQVKNQYLVPMCAIYRGIALVLARKTVIHFNKLRFNYEGRCFAPQSFVGTKSA